MSKLDSIWSEAQAEAARAEGWQLAYVVNEGRPVQTAYLEIFDAGPQFKDRGAAMKFVMHRAHERSRLHIEALSACSASRLAAAARAQPPKPRKR